MIMRGLDSMLSRVNYKCNYFTDRRTTHKKESPTSDARVTEIKASSPKSFEMPFRPVLPGPPRPSRKSKLPGSKFKRSLSTTRGRSANSAYSRTSLSFSKLTFHPLDGHWASTGRLVLSGPAGRLTLAACDHLYTRGQRVSSGVQ